MSHLFSAEYLKLFKTVSANAFCIKIDKYINKILNNYLHYVAEEPSYNKPWSSKMFSYFCC